MKLLALTFLTGMAVAQPCLVVHPVKINFAGVPTECVTCRTAYWYDGSLELPVKDVKQHYSKKDIQKLEDRGVKIATVPGPAGINVRLDGAAANDIDAVKNACK
jgi:hypothetical protein